MKIVVCGAGIAGLTMAHRAAALGAEVVLLERSPAPRTQGYMIDFFGPGYDAVETMGLLPMIEDVAYRFDEVRFVDEHGRRRAGARPARFARGTLLNVMRPDLEQVLREHLPPEVDRRFGTGPVAVEERGDESVRITLDDGVELDADLLVGADGIHSIVRRLVFGAQERFFRYLGFHTAAFTFDAPKIHTALQGRAWLTDTVNRQMGFYALRDGRIAAFAVHRTADPALPTDVRMSVRHTYGGLGWVTPTALDRCPPSAEIYYDHVAQIEMPRWSKGRVVLVGDACYAVSLLAGQGASLGIAGAYLLADQLARAESVEAALRRYETLWRPVVEEKQKTGRAAARWFLPPSRSHLLLRRATVRLARLPVLDRYVAATLAGDSTTLIKDLGRQRAATTDRRRTELSRGMADGARRQG